MITVDVEIDGLLKSPDGRRKFEFQMQDDTTYGELLMILGYSAAESRYISVIHDGKLRDLQDIVKSKEKVFLMLPVGGG